MTITVHSDMLQGSDEWHEARRGLLTASEMGLIVTPTLKSAANAKSRAHVYELLAQRISGYVEPSYIGDDMLRGWDDEITARDLYVEHFAPVTEVGFVTNDRWGFTIGCSPDGLVGDDGMIEIKSRRQKFQVQTIIEDAVPAEYMVQIQTSLLVTERRWCDFISYSGGLPCAPIRVEPDPEYVEAITEAATAFEAAIADLRQTYTEKLAARRFIETERRIEQEITI